MSESRCSTPECDKPVLIHSRQLCSRCYQRFKKTDAFVPTRDVSTYHRLTDVDRQARTATCSICGPTTFWLRATDSFRCTATSESVSVNRKRRYNVPREHYLSMHAAQDGRCAICGKSEEDNGRQLSLDHCHKTGRIRGLLCWYCNTGLGKLGDTAASVRRALEYLEAAERD